MELYVFSDRERAVLEGLPTPLVIYQYADKRITPLIISDGFRRLFGLDDPQKAYSDLSHEMYSLIHPDDIARTTDAVFRFVDETGSGDVIYRTRTRHSSDYRMVHSVGKHVYTESGVRLDYVWYMDEGVYSEETVESQTRLSRALNDALHEESALQASRYDYMTGLPTMTYFLELAMNGRTAALNEGGNPALLYLNLVGMKSFNQKFGFAEGDELLKAFGSLLAATFGNENCCHIGQDHFAAYAVEDGLEQKLAQLIDAAGSLNGGNTLPVHIGIYPNRIEAVSASIACDRAKIACDAIKKSFHSAYSYYTEELRETINRRQYIQANLDRAIAEKWIQVYYQPIIRAANQRVCNEESLSRWIDPELGMIPPDGFIPYLEDSGQIYMLDLYVVEQVLEKMKLLQAKGHLVVPHSINLSRSDFDACDIVEELCRRVDDAGVDRSLIAVEITESSIGSDFDHMKQQVARFRALGFQVWLDDFGCGYSSLDALQSIRFDLIKFDMRFMKKLDESENSRIVLTELVRLATTLGSETVCEGVEALEQVQFLQEIGCSKLQGYYFSRPLPLREILDRCQKPVLGYENPDEAKYYEAIGRVNLYDLDLIGSEGESGFHNYFDTLPMGIIEIRGNTSRFVRSNKSYRDFVKRFLGVDIAREGTMFRPYDDDFMNNVVKTCCELGIKAFYDQQVPNGSIVHSFARRIETNPVSGTTAIAAVVLSITDANEGTTYASIARALASDYYNIYYVDLETEHFIEYSSPAGREGLALERHGEQFFLSTRQAAAERIYAEDRAGFLKTFTKENVVQNLDAHGIFTISYRLMDSGAPVYVGMKISRMHQGGNQIIIGISVIDAQVRQKAEEEQKQQEQAALRRLAALAGNCIAVYSVDPVSGQYIEYDASESYSKYGLEKEGDDFFAKLREEAPKYTIVNDISEWLQAAGKERMLEEIKRNGLFSLDYDLLLDDMPTPVSLRAAMVKEGGNERMIVGIMESARIADRPAKPDKTVFQQMADSMIKPCAILSVEKGPNKTAGTIRIVCANEAYKKAMGSKYYDNMPYDELVPKVLRFENSCYHCAFEHRQIHVYTQTKVNELWTDQQLTPLHSDREDVGYCQFIMELSEAPDRERMASVPVRTASAVLQAAITLLGTNDLRERVGTVLSDILELSEAFSVRVMLADHENKRAINYCDRWAIPIAESYTVPEDPDHAVISYPLMCSWGEYIGDNSYLLVTNSQDMDALAQRNPTWVKTMRAYGVETLMLIPFRHENEITGYLYLCNFNPDMTEEIREMAELMSFFLGTEIYNAVLLRRLDEMSHTDALTGLNNRNAMILRTKLLGRSAEPIPFGVVNLDLNGLKNVNDREGHDAGDRLLVSAAEMLKKYFYEGDLYRTGGDEFIVIATGITCDVFERKVERLRRATAKEGNVSFAVGACWSDGSEDIVTTFRHADEKMYEDKKAYYEAHPEQRR